MSYMSGIFIYWSPAYNVLAAPVGRTKLTVTISFPREMADLKRTGGDLYKEYRNTLPGMSVEQTKQIEAAIKTGNFLEAASVVQTFKNLSGIEFNIAITGESGSGKSSLVNAIRGLGNDDEGAAETRVVEMTKEPVPYWHLMCPMMIVWDLPAIGTPDFQPDAYLKQVKFRRYDVFIIIASERSRFCHTKLAREIQKMGKKFFFVRSKVDLDLYNEESKVSINEERTLEKIRNDCVNNLSRIGMRSPQVFLVSSWEFQKYDSPQLQKTLLKELYHHKMETFKATEAPSSSSCLRKSVVWQKGIQDGSSATDHSSPVSNRCSVNPVLLRSWSQEKRTSR
uniref:IRG-type G domain-containing protein n=1 Tax=Chrysemys picta bellii TaxID=8478 RepID=A0A8C3IA73_CHRPI